MTCEGYIIKGLDSHSINRILFQVFLLEGHVRSILHFVLTCKQAFNDHYEMLFHLKLLRINCSRYRKKNYHLLNHTYLPVVFLDLANVDESTQLANLLLFNRLRVCCCEFAHTQKPEALWYKLLNNLPPTLEELVILMNREYPLPVDAEYAYTHNRPWLPRLKSLTIRCKGRSMTGYTRDRGSFIRRNRSLFLITPSEVGQFLIPIIECFKESLECLIIGNIDSEVLRFKEEGWDAILKFRKLKWIIFNRKLDLFTSGVYMESNVRYRMLEYDSFKNHVVMFESQVFIGRARDQYSTWKGYYLLVKALRTFGAGGPIPKMTMSITHF